MIGTVSASRRSGALVIAVLGAALALPALAQDGDTNARDGAPEQRPERADTAAEREATAPVPGKERPGGEGRFRPSEEISEDLSVPFPVDI